MRTLNTCKKCGYQWFSREGKIAPVCPSCHTYWWNRDKPERHKRAYVPHSRAKGNNYIQAVALRQASPCMTAIEIGNRLGISRERVRQILANAGLPTKHYSRKKICANCGKTLHYGNISGYCQKCLPIVHSVPIICDNCGALFHRPQWRVITDNRRPNHSGKAFCSKKCQGAYLGQHYGFKGDMARGITQ